LQQKTSRPEVKMVYGAKYNTLTKDNPYQRYFLLCKQQESLRRKTSTQSPVFSPLSDASSEFSSLSSSPTIAPKYGSDLPSLSMANLGSISTMATTAPISTIPGIAHRRNHSADSSFSDNYQKELYDITMAIKASLTELLNEESIKHDDRIRAEIQYQLMETEKQLKQQRRRRSSVDRATADSIAGSFKFSP
jgi:hypothetical protein